MSMLTMNNGAPIRKNTHKMWDGKAKVSNRKTEERTPHRKETEPGKKTRIEYNFIDIIYDPDREERINAMNMAQDELLCDPEAKVYVNNRRVGQADFDLLTHTNERQTAAVSTT